MALSGNSEQYVSMFSRAYIVSVPAGVLADISDGQ
jgi:hypothetical protein